MIAFIDLYKDDFKHINKRDLIDVLSSNSSFFRMVFDGNYQNGFRPQYASRIAPETGEMILRLNEM
ncbi:hypothetical protein [Enterococcus italicus]|uniref:hypothetical protein n=1 Tax=Enterococcus italicus TaxID=246144 RepID=UPI002073BA43|nr:hypothetical protein [Enterococcus italicus]